MIQEQPPHNTNDDVGQPSHMAMVEDMMKQANISEGGHDDISAGLDLALKFMNSDETLLQHSDIDDPTHDKDGDKLNRNHSKTDSVASQASLPSHANGNKSASSMALERITSRLSIKSDKSETVAAPASASANSKPNSVAPAGPTAAYSQDGPAGGATTNTNSKAKFKGGLKFRQSIGNIKNVLTRTVSNGPEDLVDGNASGSPVNTTHVSSFKGPMQLHDGGGDPQKQHAKSKSSSSEGGASFSSNYISTSSYSNSHSHSHSHSNNSTAFTSSDSRSPTKAGSVSSGCTVHSTGTHGENDGTNSKIDEFEEIILHDSSSPTAPFNGGGDRTTSPYTNKNTPSGRSNLKRHSHYSRKSISNTHNSPGPDHNPSPSPSLRFSPSPNPSSLKNSPVVHGHHEHERSDSRGSKRLLFDTTVGASSSEEDDDAKLYKSAAPRRVMTKAQYETFRKSIIGTSALGGAGGSDSEDSDDSAGETSGLTKKNKKKSKGGDMDDYDQGDLSSDEEESEASRLKNLRQKFDENNSYRQSVRMRMNQDAHLSVYRQKMMKLTGQNLSLSNNRPYSAFVNSSVDLVNAGAEEDEDDDEYDNVPLGILRAHGFPTGGSHHFARNSTVPATPRPLGESQSVSNLNLGQSSPRPATVGYPGSAGGGGGGGAYETMSLRSMDVKSLNGTSNLRAFGNRRSAIFSHNELTGAPRGLIGEIAREEEARMKRRSMAGLGGYLRSSSTTNLAGAGGASGGGVPTSPSAQSLNGVSPSSGSATKPDAIQMQLQQMMQMQYQMLAQMQGAQPHGQHGHGGSPQLSPGLFGVGGHVQHRPSQSTLPRVGGGRPMMHGGPSQSSLPLHRMGSAYSIRTAAQNAAGTSAYNGRDDDGDDDDDDLEDEKAWRELEAKRQHIRQMWQTNGPSGATTAAGTSV